MNKEEVLIVLISFLIILSISCIIIILRNGEVFIRAPWMTWLNLREDTEKHLGRIIAPRALWFFNLLLWSIILIAQWHRITTFLSITILTLLCIIPIYLKIKKK
jgi:hypothetical protein